MREGPQEGQVCNVDHKKFKNKEFKSKKVKYYKVKYVKWVKYEV